jgi:hypothetical protein
MWYLYDATYVYIYLLSFNNTPSPPPPPPPPPPPLLFFLLYTGNREAALSILKTQRYGSVPWRDRIRNLTSTSVWGAQWLARAKEEGSRRRGGKGDWGGRRRRRTRRRRRRLRAGCAGAQTVSEEEEKEEEGWKTFAFDPSMMQGEKRRKTGHRREGMGMQAGGVL